MKHLLITAIAAGTLLTAGCSSDTPNDMGSPVSDQTGKGLVSVSTEDVLDNPTIVDVGTAMSDRVADGSAPYTIVSTVLDAFGAEARTTLTVDGDTVRLSQYGSSITPAVVVQKGDEVMCIRTLNGVEDDTSEADSSATDWECKTPPVGSINTFLAEVSKNDAVLGLWRLTTPATLWENMGDPTTVKVEVQENSPQKVVYILEDGKMEWTVASPDDMTFTDEFTGTGQKAGAVLSKPLFTTPEIVETYV